MGRGPPEVKLLYPKSLCVPRRGAAGTNCSQRQVLFSIGCCGQFFGSERMLVNAASSKLKSSEQHFGIFGSQCES
eukprot:scaffold43496_cov1153-Skeletonema_marinoi.AAC.1